jgi:glycosyltransferase involved in cell wall biosynthesis
VPDAKLKLAGKKMPDYIKAYAGSNVEVHDFVQDGKGFIGNGGIMIVPLFSGSGMRVKIVEGMAMGKAIVTTAIGAEGIAGKDGQEFLIANTNNEFADAVIRLLQSPEKQQEIGKNARLYSEKVFDNSAIGKQLIAFYESLEKE